MSRTAVAATCVLIVALLVLAAQGQRLSSAREHLRTDQAARRGIAEQFARYAALRARAPDDALAEPLDHRAIAAVSKHLEAAGGEPAQIESITVGKTPANGTDTAAQAGSWALRIALRGIPMPVLGRFAAAMHDDAMAWRAAAVRLSRARLRTDANGCMFDVDLTYRPTRRRSDDHGQ